MVNSIENQMNGELLMPKKLCITLDLDWIHDDIAMWVIDWIENEKIPITVFATHLSPAVQRMRDSSLVEVGIHPNFNDILSGDISDETAFERIKTLKNIIPEATSIRSHSLTQNSRLLDFFSDIGFTHEVNTFIPATTGQYLSPWMHCDSNMIRVPYIFDDSLASRIEGMWDVGILNKASLSVINFHFGRLFINAFSAKLPEEAISVRNSPDELSNFRTNIKEMGSMHLLKQLISVQKVKNIEYKFISELQL